MAASSSGKRLLAIAALACGAVLGPGWAGQAQRAAPAKSDLYGDPLPAGAIARCGTVRLLHPSIFYGLAAAFSPDGKNLATQNSSELRLWDRETGKLLREIKENLQVNTYPGGLRFSPDGKQLAMVGKDKSVRLVDPNTGKSLQRIPAEMHAGPSSPEGNVLAFSPDGMLLAKSGLRGQVVLWDTATGKKVFRLTEHEAVVGAGAFTPKGDTLVTVCQGKRICHWNVATGELTKRVDLDLPKSNSGPWGLSPDGRLVPVYYPDTGDAVALLDSSTGKQLCELEGTARTNLYGLAFTPDSRIVATNCRSSGEVLNVSLYDAATGKLRQRFRVPEQDWDNLLLITPDGKTVLTKSPTAVHLWDAATGKRLPDRPAHDSSITALTFTRDGRDIVSASGDGTIRVWEAATGKHERALTGRRQEVSSSVLSLTSHRHAVSSLALSPDAKAVLSGSDDGTLILQDLSTGKELWRFLVSGPPEDLMTRRVKQAAITADGRSVVSLSYTERDQAWVHVLDLETGKERMQRSMRFKEFLHGLFSPDCKLLLGCRDDRAKTSEFGLQGFPEERRDKTTATLQEIVTGREVFAVRQPDINDDCYQFSSDSKTLVTVTRRVPPSQDYRHASVTLRLWELASGKERLAIHLPAEGDGLYISLLALSPDRRTLAAVRGVYRPDVHYILQLWDVASGKELLRRTGKESEVSALVFDPGGKRLASGNRDGTILVWDLTPEIDQRPLPPKPDAKTLEQWWTALAGDDAKQAHAAIWGLIATPEQAVPLLRGRLRPVSAPPAEKLKQLLADLDSDEFGRRNAASKELAELEELAEPAVREALKQDIPAEQRRRLEKLLDISLVVRSPEKLRQLRALEVLEQIGTAEARQVLETMTKGAPEARLTREAKASLERTSRDGK